MAFCIGKVGRMMRVAKGVTRKHKIENRKRRIMMTGVGEKLNRQIGVDSDKDGEVIGVAFGMMAPTVASTEARSALDVESQL